MISTSPSYKTSENPYLLIINKFSFWKGSIKIDSSLASIPVSLVLAIPFPSIAQRENEHSLYWVVPITKVFF